MTSIIDYDAGNIRSVEKALLSLGEKVLLTDDPDRILSADHIILPGVGAFGDAMEHLNSRGLVPVIREAVRRGIPFLGICLGMQLLFSASEESPGVEGLKLLPGTVVRIPEGDGLKIPHMGWNNLQVKEGAALFRGLETAPFVYFVHSYYVKAADPGVVAARAEYGVPMDVSVESGRIFGCQFHPEKSSDTGLSILRNFLAVPGPDGKET